MICPECNIMLPWSAEELEDGEVLFCDECEEPLEVVFLDGGSIALDTVDMEQDDDF